MSTTTPLSDTTLELLMKHLTANSDETPHSTEKRQQSPQTTTGNRLHR
jgi:hypothetical protein